VTRPDLNEVVVRWHRAVSVWASLHEADAAEARQYLGRLLDGHLLDAPPPAGDLGDVDPDLLVECEVALVNASGAFDEDGYADANRHIPAIRERQVSAVEHFCSTGWEWLRNPRADFDMWWYWFEHLDPRRTQINPFVHYLLVGRHLGLATSASRQPERPDPPVFEEGITRRICLFAAYDVDGIVDDYVVHYLQELSRFADVYYLADGRMPEAELAKIADVTKGAWAIPHGRYDFGSFSTLAEELVGWDIIDQYDEMLLANDSCYLLRPLDEVFGTMDAVATDWWGLQGSKADFGERYGHHEPIPFAAAKGMHSERDDWYCYFRLHLSSYFLVFRKRVMDDPGFRRRLSTVASQEHKMLIVLKYEIGLSDYLLRAGFVCDTYIPDLYPFHPIYSNDYFKLLEQGFPLLKRNLINENSLRVPDLAQWKERVRPFSRDAPLDSFEANLRRVSADDRLRASLAVRTRPDGTVDHHRPLGRRKFRAADRTAPTFDHWWAFPVCADEHTLTGSERAVFEEVADDPSIKKIVLTRSRRIDLPGTNVVSAPITSPEGQHHLARSGQVFLKHGPLVDVLPWNLSTTTRNFINLSQGTPLRRFGRSLDSPDAATLERLHRNNAGNRAAVAAGPLDRLAMAAALYPVPYDAVWETGLPRHDLVLRPEDRLLPDMQDALRRLREEVAGRRLVLLVPGVRSAKAPPGLRFSDREAADLASWARRNDAVLGVRESISDRGRLFAQLLPHGALNLGVRRFADFEVLLRVADIMVSDCSPSLIDFTLTGRPIVSFAPPAETDSDSDSDDQLYNLDRMLPGPTCRTADQLLDALDRVLLPRDAAAEEEYLWRRSLFVPRIDDQAAWRVVQKVKSLYVTGP